MKTNTKIILDTYIIGFVAKLINILVIPLGKVLNINHNLNKSFKTIAICKYKGMGSIIQSTPLIQTIKTNHPNCRIIYISSIENQQILKQIEGIDEVLLIDDRTFFSLLLTFIPFVNKLIRRKIEVLIDLEVYSNFSTLVSVLSMSKNRLGFYINSKHYRLGNYTHMMYYNTRSAISETYLQFARLLNCSDIKSKLYNLSNNIALADIAQKLNINLQSQNYILINPNASDLRVERQWPRAKFIDFINKLIEEFPSKNILLVGSKGEASYVEGIIKDSNASDSILSIAGKTNIPELIAIIQHAKLLITNDTGPMHIAFSVETPTIALFGPCSPTQYGMSDNCHIVYQNLYCSPCVHEFITPPCRGNNYCMKSIDSASVFQLATDIINGIDIKKDSINKDILFKFKDFTVGTVNRAD